MAEVALIIAAIVVGMAAIPATLFLLWFVAPFVLIGVGAGAVVFVCSNHTLPLFFAVAGVALVAVGGIWLFERYDEGE